MQEKVTIKIPGDIYKRLSRMVANSGFTSVTQFVVFVMRTVMMNMEQDSTPTADELRRMTRNIEKSGHLREEPGRTREK